MHAWRSSSGHPSAAPPPAAPTAAARALTPTKQQYDEQQKRNMQQAQQQQSMTSNAASPATSAHQRTLSYSAALFKSLADANSAAAPPAAASSATASSSASASSASSASATASASASRSRAPTPQSLLSSSSASCSLSQSLVESSSSLSLSLGGAEPESSCCGFISSSAYRSHTHSPLQAHEQEHDKSSPSTAGSSTRSTPRAAHLSVNDIADHAATGVSPRIPFLPSSLPPTLFASGQRPAAGGSSGSGVLDAAGFPALGGVAVPTTQRGAWTKAPPIIVKEKATQQQQLHHAHSTGTPLSHTPSRTPAAGTPVRRPSTPTAASLAALAESLLLQPTDKQQQSQQSQSLHPSNFIPPVPRSLLTLAPRRTTLTTLESATSSASASSANAASSSSGSSNDAKSPQQQLVVNVSSLPPGPPSTASMPTASGSDEGGSKHESLLSGGSSGLGLDASATTSSTTGSRGNKKRVRRRAKQHAFPKLSLDQLGADSRSTSASLGGSLRLADTASISSSSLARDGSFRAHSPVRRESDGTTGGASAVLTRTPSLASMSVSVVSASTTTAALGEATTPSTPTFASERHVRQQRQKSERASRPQQLRNTHSSASLSASIPSSGTASPMLVHSSSVGTSGLHKSSSARNFTHITSGGSFRPERSGERSLRISSSHSPLSTPTHYFGPQLHFFPMSTSGTATPVSAAPSTPILSSSSSLSSSFPSSATSSALPRLELVKLQLEYYFSADNLAKDVYLRSLMNARGYVPIARLLEFNRLKQLTQRPQDVLIAVTASRLLKLKNGAVRSRLEWAKFVKTPEQLQAEMAAASAGAAAAAGEQTDEENEEMRIKNLGLTNAAEGAPQPAPSPAMSSSSDGSASEVMIARQQQHLPVPMPIQVPAVPMAFQPMAVPAAMLGPFMPYPAATQAGPFFPYYAAAPTAYSPYVGAPQLIPVYSSGPAYPMHPFPFAAAAPAPMIHIQASPAAQAAAAAAGNKSKQQASARSKLSTEQRRTAATGTASSQSNGQQHVPAAAAAAVPAKDSHDELKRTSSLTRYSSAPAAAAASS